MKATHTSNAQPIPCWRSSTVNLTLPTSSLILGLESRYLAYKLAYLSRTRIEKEACKAEPRLCKPIGLAALFDHVREFIISQSEYEDEEEADGTEDLVDDSDEEADARCQHFEKAEDIDIDDLNLPLPSTEPAGSMSIMSSDMSSLRRNENTKQLPVINATRIEAKEVDPDDWENESDSSTESEDNDQDSEGEWSNSIYEEDIQLQHSRR
jgi:hypothetical protein